MNCRIRRICRGQGTAYIQVELRGVRPDASIAFYAYSEHGVALPIEFYLVSKTTVSGSGFVLATPLLDTRFIEIRCCAKLVDGGEDNSVFRLSRTYIKWASRLNYMIDFEETSRLRDTDRVTYSNQIHVNPGTCVVDEAHNQVIMKGIICMPKSCEDCHISVIDGSGNTASDCVLTIGRKTEVTALGLKRIELGFTVRIPKGDRTYCVSAASPSQVKSGFLCLDSASVTHYIASLCPHFYRSSGASYAGVAASRARYVAALDAQDFDFNDGVLFSVVVPLFHTPARLFDEMISSVLSQFYVNWELILVNASPDDEVLRERIASLADNRIRIIELDGNQGIADNTNAGIDVARGDYIALLDHDDVLDQFALYRYAKQVEEHPDIDVLYCDEDFLNEQGEYIAPHFKSDFNLDLLRCHNYITHFLAVRSSYAKALRLDHNFDGAQDYDFVLRLSEVTQKIVHIPEVLYHWRISDTSTAKSSDNKGYAHDAGLRALKSHIERCGIDAAVKSTSSPCYYNVDYSVSGCPLVSIIIPTKDNVEVLKRCVESIQQKTSYANFEIILVENNSENEATFSFYDELKARYSNIEIVVYEPKGFNFSAINNFGVDRAARGDYLIFLNNDTEVISSDWIETMLSVCQRDDVGAVGAKLLFPDDTVQHAGVVMMKCGNVNDLGGPIHVFSHIDRDDPGYMRRAILRQDVSAVTGACLMTPRAIFDLLGGFNEDLAVAFNDVDYCLRVRDLNALVVYEPNALLYHYESVTRGYESDEKLSRFLREQSRLRLLWSDYYTQGDPYHGPACTLGVIDPL